MADLGDMPDIAWKAFGLFTKAHVAVYKATGGRIGHRFVEGSPVCLVEHVGAKSGTHRTSPLIYGRDGEAIVIVASKGGVPSHPAWYHNLMANPETEVQVKSEHRKVRAREATEAERHRLWPKMDEIYSDYAAYRESAAKADRVIPILLLEPR